MPRYFFNVIDGRSIIDNQGSELAGLKEARVEAIQLAGAILRDEGDTFWNGEEWHMHVTDASGQSVLKLRFSADDQGIAPEEDREVETQA
jgi:GTP-dependent phosphoenolpyruvate carboxykinase